MTKSKQTLALTRGRIAPTLMRFALPFLGATVLQLLYGIVDMVIVGQYSDAAGISAVNNSGQIMQLVTALICGVATGGSVLIGQYIGAKQEREAGKTIGNMIFLFLALAVVITGVLMVFSNGLVSLLRVPREAVRPARWYLRICGFGTVFIVGYNAVACVLRGIGDSKRPMYFIAISCALNVIGDLILVGGLRLGAAGAAIATAGAQAVSFLTALIFLRRAGLPVPVLLELDWGKFFRVLRLGLPVALQDVLTNLSFIIITVVVNQIGLEQSAAVGVVERIIGIAMAVPSAFMGTLSVFAAQNIGARQPERAKRGMWIGTGVSLAISVIPFAALELVPEILMRLFTPDAQVIFHGALYLRTYAIDGLLVCLVFCLNGFFSGCGHTGFTMFNCLFSTFLVRVPLVIWFSTWAGVTMLHIGIAAPAASLVQIVLQLIYYRTGRWKKSILGELPEEGGV